MIIKLNATTPAPPDGMQNVHFRDDGTHLGTSADPEPVSAYAPNTGGAAVKTAAYALTAADCGKLIVANSAAATIFTLPAAVPFAQWQVKIANIGAGALSVVPGGALTLDGATSAISVGQLQSISVHTDGANYLSGRGSGNGNATRIQGISVSATAPTNGQVLQYSSVSGLYVPTTPSGGGGSTGLFSGYLSATPSQASTGFNTWVNQGSSTATDLASGIALYTAVGGSDNWHLLVKAAPTPPYTVNALIAATACSTSFQEAGIGWRDSASGKFTAFSLRSSANNTGIWQVASNDWNSPTSLTTGRASLGNIGPMTWLQLKDDGTTVTESVSVDGKLWLTVYSVAKSSGFLGSSGYNQIHFGIDNATASGNEFGGVLMSYEETSP